MMRRRRKISSLVVVGSKYVVSRNSAAGSRGQTPIDPGSRGQGSKGQKVKLTRQKAVCAFGPTVFRVPGLLLGAYDNR